MPRWIEADALSLPFPDQHFNLVTSAFGFRNLADYDAGLREIVRVLKPGGECGILDFSEPKGLMGRLYRIYFKQVLPRVGTMLSGVRGPYAYLPNSVERFPEPQKCWIACAAPDSAKPVGRPTLSQLLACTAGRSESRREPSYPASRSSLLRPACPVRSYLRLQNTLVRSVSSFPFGTRVYRLFPTEGS
jgi:SAM-dependent methyltransferase